MADNAVSSNGTFLMDRNLKMEDNAVNSSGTFLVDLNLKMEDNAASDAGSPSSSCRPLINQQTTDNGGNKHKGNGNKKKQDGKFWLKFVIIFGMLDLMLISAIVIIHYPNVWPNYSKTDQVPTPLVDFRLPCHAAADDTDGDRRDAWCVGEEATLSDTLTKFAEAQYHQKRAKGFDSERLYGNDIKLNSTSALLKQIYINHTSGITVVNWKVSSINGSNITRQDGGLRVNADGIYHISSQLVFVDDRRNKENTLYSHSIWLLRDGKEDEMLLKTISSDCIMTSSPGNCSIPSYHGAIFELTKGDVVEVRVTDDVRDSISSSHDDYFGLNYIK